MGRRQVRVVIARRRIDVVTPGRLQADGNVAQAEGGNGEAAAIRAPGLEKRIGLRRPPALHDFVTGRFGQGGEETFVVGQGEELAAMAPGVVIGRPGLNTVD